MPVGSSRFGARSPRSTLGILDLAEPLYDRLINPMACRRRRRMTVATVARVLRRLTAATGKVALVGGNHHSAPGDFLADELGGHVLALGDATHLRVIMPRRAASNWVSDSDISLPSAGIARIRLWELSRNRSEDLRGVGRSTSYALSLIHRLPQLTSHR